MAGSSDSSCWIWNGLNGELLNSFYHEDGLTCGGFSNDGKLLITASEDRSIRVWKPLTGEQLKKISGFGFHEGKFRQPPPYPPQTTHIYRHNPLYGHS